VRGFAAALVSIAVAAGVMVAVPAIARNGATTNGIFSDSLQPEVLSDADRASVELGLRFTPTANGSVTALQYYQGKAAVTSATLWSASGKVLASVSVPKTAGTGWKSVPLTNSIALAAGTTYVVSYHASKGAYPVTENDLVATRTQNGFSLGKSAGVYTYGSQKQFPRQTYRGSNYLVDIVFAPKGTDAQPAKPTVSPTPTATPKPSPSVTPTPKPSVTPTATPTPTPTPSVTPTATPTPTPSVTPTPSPAAPAPTNGSGWAVTTRSVGLAPFGLSCSALPRYTGSSDVPAGTVISGKLITTTLNLSAGNITIEKSCIQPTSVGTGMPVVATKDFNTMKITTAKVIIRDSEFDGSKLSAYSAAYSAGFIGIADLLRNYIHGFGSGIALMDTGQTLSATVEGNYVTDLLSYGDASGNGTHADAFTIRDFSAASSSQRSLIVRNNRFDCDAKNATGALFIQTYAGRIDNVLIEGNLLEGDGYQLGLNQLYSPYSNLRAVNNRFSGTGWGAAYVQGGGGWADWSSNYIYNANASNGQGSVVREP